MPTTHVYSSTQTAKLGSQAEKQSTPRTEIQTGRTSSCANHQPDSTTFKNATVIKMAIKQGSAFNETSIKPVTCIRAARKQGNPTIREGTSIKNVIESGNVSAPMTMAHDPGLASNRLRDITTGKQGFWKESTCRDTSNANTLSNYSNQLPNTTVFDLILNNARKRTCFPKHTCAPLAACQQEWKGATKIVSDAVPRNENPVRFHEKRIS